MTASIDNKFEQVIWKALEDVKDPEIPVISVVDLGIISDVTLSDDSSVTVSMTPTFTACPATNYMKEDIQKRLELVEGVEKVEVKIDFSVSWSSDKITEKGRKQLKAFGLAPPPKHEGELDMDKVADVPCPYCDTTNTSLMNPFGPTLCRSVHYCHDCKEAFQQFKPVQ